MEQQLVISALEHQLSSCQRSCSRQSLEIVLLKASSASLSLGFHDASHAADGVLLFTNKQEPNWQEKLPISEETVCNTVNKMTIAKWIGESSLQESEEDKFQKRISDITKSDRMQLLLRQNYMLDITWPPRNSSNKWKSWRESCKALTRNPPPPYPCLQVSTLSLTVYMSLCRLRNGQWSVSDPLHNEILDCSLKRQMRKGRRSYNTEWRP